MIIYGKKREKTVIIGIQNLMGYIDKQKGGLVSHERSANGMYT